MGVVASILLCVLLATPAAYAQSPSHMPVPQLSWTEGNPFPIVNGHVTYPPKTPEPRGPSGYSSHWYAGGVDSSSTPQDATTISTTITVPNSTPNSGDFYYVLLSAFDNAGSYDQLGFSADYGKWGLTYSWTYTKGRHTTYYYSPDAMELTAGQTYTFTITTTGGVTHFATSSGWSLDAPTGGNYQVLAPSYSGYYDYTDYEEIWQTSTRKGVPAFDFVFSSNSWISTGGISSSWTNWTQFTTNKTPSNVSVTVNSTTGDVTIIDNP